MTTGHAALPVALQVLEIDENQGKAFFANMLLIVWRKNTTLAAYKRVASSIRDLARAHADGVGVLQLVERTATPPDADTKREFLSVLELAQGLVKHYSVIYEGSGFAAAGFRAVMLGAYTYARPKFEHKVFDSLRAAASWHVKQQELIRPTTMTPVLLVEAMQALRDEVGRAATAEPR